GPDLDLSGLRDDTEVADAEFRRGHDLTGRVRSLAESDIEPGWSTPLFGLRSLVASRLLVGPALVVRLAEQNRLGAGPDRERVEVLVQKPAGDRIEGTGVEAVRARR